MIRILTICLIALLMLNIAAYTQTAKPTPAPQKIDGYIFKNSDTVLLTESNVCNLDLRLLTLARNEIYARHGHTFKDKSLQDYFNNRKWYKIDAKYTAKLSDVEVKNVELIKKVEEKLKKYRYGDSMDNVAKNVANFDLNGDGKIDNIKLNAKKAPYDFTLTIMINGVTHKDNGGDSFSIVDIDENDKIKEIAIQEYGPSDDFATSFYLYDGRKIIKIGKIDGLCVFDNFIAGNGIVYGNTRFIVLQTWFYKDEYKLTAKHLLQHVDKPYYLASSAQPFKPSLSQPPVTVWKSIHLYESPNSKKVVAKLKVGEKVNIIGSDNKKWCLVKLKDGRTGWFEVSGEYGIKVKELGVDAQAVFEGLCMAD
jgi:hypothetical protein